jgi:hypothetical protein
VTGPAIRFRAGAGLVALIAWIGLALQFQASLGLTGAAPAALWAMLRYYTVLSNLFVATVLTGTALGWRGWGTPLQLGGATLTIALVGVVYALLLRGLVELAGIAKAADVLLHEATPALTVLFWLVLAPKGGLRWRYPLIWLGVLLAYFLYVLARARFDGAYPYPFIDLSRIGWARMCANGAAIGAAYLAAGIGVVWVDGRLAAGRRPG